MSMRISEQGLDLIKDYEGCVLTAYPDPATGGDPWTVGFGHTGPDVHPGLKITDLEADRLLEDDCLKFERGVTELVKAPRLLQHEFDALVSFAFNLGLENLKASMLLKKLNAEDYLGAANEFVKWNHANGKVMPGLTRRRQAEERLFRGQR